jgi:hypothetical protein
LLSLAGLAVVLVATLTPISDPRGMAGATPLLCVVCGDQGGADVAVNLLLFLPLAAGLGIRGLAWKRVVPGCFLLSFLVELLQFHLVAGRDASLSDVLTNTTGAAIGAAIGITAPRWLLPTPRRARALLAAWSIFVLGVLGSWAWLLTPAMRPGPLLSRWAHEAPGGDVFDGRVRSVRLNGRPMPPNGPPPDSAMLRRELAGGRFRLETDVISGRPVRDRLWIYMFRTPSGGALTLSQLRRQAVVAVPTRGLEYRLHPAVLTLADAFPDTSGVPVHLEASGSSLRFRLSSAFGGRERTLALSISPAFGWIQFTPFQLVAGTNVRWVSGALLLALWLPIGYWTAWSGRRGQALVIVAGSAGLALGLGPALAGFPPAHWSEWLAVLAGAIAGWILHGLVVAPSQASPRRAIERTAA